MTLSSMTGFASSFGEKGGLHWQWELKSVNGKALDIRCRLPSGFEGLEAVARTVIARHIKRGNIQAALTVSGTSTADSVIVNEAVLDQILSAAEKLRERIGGPAPNAEALLALRGVIDMTQAVSSEQELKERSELFAASLEKAVEALNQSRLGEGERLKAVIAAQVERIERLVREAHDSPARSVEAVKVRLKEQVWRLLETGASFDPDRLHQEAILIATRADIQEELDRLAGHVAAARALLASPEPAGRKFDFLAQEFNREANTLCSKAQDISLTNIGLELKTTIDQMREQVQNIE